MNDDNDRKRILERRARYVAMALAGVGTATQAACGPCLSASVDADRTDANIDAGTDASIDASRMEVGPCLSPPFDASPPILDSDLDASADLDGASGDLDAHPEDALTDDTDAAPEDAP